MKNRNLSDIALLVICHVVGFGLVTVFSLFANQIAESFPSLPVRLLFPANLSPWEQSKMLVVPLSLIFFAEYFIVGKNFKNFMPAHFLIAFALPIIMTILYSLYTVFLGGLDSSGAQSMFLLTLLLAALLASILLVTSDKDLKKRSNLFIILYFSMNIAYIILTYHPPRLEFLGDIFNPFFDSVNNVFGPAY